MDKLYVLGQTNPNATSYTTMYTVPDLAQTTTSSLTVCNTSASTVTFRVSVHVAGALAGTPGTNQFIFYDTPLGGNATMTVVLGMTLYSSDLIQVYASTGDLAFNLFGVETS